MEPKDKVMNAASTVAEGVKDAAETLVGATADAISTIRGRAEAGADVAESGNLTEVDPDPGNRSGIRDTAGDTGDH